MLTKKSGIAANRKITKCQMSKSIRTIDRKGKIEKGRSIENKENPANSSGLNQKTFEIQETKLHNFLEKTVLLEVPLDEHSVDHVLALAKRFHLSDVQFKCEMFLLNDQSKSAIAKYRRAKEEGLPILKVLFLSNLT